MTTKFQWALFALAATGASSAHALPAQTAEYVVRDEIRGGNVHLANFAVRPMVMVPDPGGTVERPKRLWAVNTTEDLVETFQQRSGSFGAQATPGLSIHVPRDPVSLGYWAAGDQILVICRGTNGITRLSADDGSIIDHITLTPGGLPGVGNEGHGGIAEPGDVLIDEATGMAFVSCSGVDAVIQIDLAAGTIVRRFSYWNEGTDKDANFQCKNPLFLSFAPGDAGPTGRKVLVAPLRSGNGSSLIDSDGTGLARPGRIGVAPSTDPRSIPDEDLFEITPFGTGNNGTVGLSSKMTGIGTVLFAQGMHPTTGEHWQLTTELFNAEEENSSEPLVNGRFAENRLRRTTLFGLGGQSTKTHSLEQSGPGAGDGVGQPYALAFGPFTDAGFTAGVLTDNVVQIGTDGLVDKEWDLPNGSIPRGLLTDTFGTAELLFVYCSGTNTIEQYRTNVSGAPLPIRTYDLTPESVTPEFKRGREIFFDGERSELGTMSCATCHVDGASDGLSWNLSDAGRQEKGPMVTQTLVGLERVGSLHWRGERELADFNGAFDGLLGGHHIPGMMAQLTGPELEDFEHFINALKNPANPYQNRARLVDSSIKFFPDYELDLSDFGMPPTLTPTPYTGDAVVGQAQFFGVGLLAAGDFRCSDCHLAPTGTSGIGFPIFPNGMSNPAGTHIKPSSLHELWRKDQAIDSNFPSQSFLGFGFSHGGVRRDLPTFLSFVGVDDTSVNPPTNSAASEISNIAQINTTEFTHQWDQGLSPASQYAYMLNTDTIATNGVVETFRYLELQSRTAVSNCDLVVIGQTNVGGTLQEVRWWRDQRTSGPRKYVSDLPGVGPRNYRDFFLGVRDLGEEHLFIGYPVGMGERMAVDRDLDGVTDRQELIDGTDPRDPLSPGAAAGSAPSVIANSDVVLWTQSIMARVSLRTNVPTTVDSLRVVETDAMDVEIGTPQLLPQDEDFSRFHAPLATGLRPATTVEDVTLAPDLTLDAPIYRVTVNFRARDGQTSSVDFPGITTMRFEQGVKHADDLGPAVFRLHAPLSRQHQISDSKVTVVDSNTYKVGVSLQYVRGKDRSLMAPNRAVMGHVVITRANGDVEVMQSGQIVPGVADEVIIVPDVEIERPGANIDVDFDIREHDAEISMPILSPDIVVAKELTDGAVAAGGGRDLEFTFEFDQTQVTLPGGGDKVTFVFDGIFEIYDDLVIENGPTLWSGALSSYGGTGVFAFPQPGNNTSQWNFPLSGEALTFPTIDL